MSDNVYQLRRRRNAPGGPDDPERRVITDPGADHDAETVPVERIELGPAVDPPDEKRPITDLIGTKADRKPIMPPWLRSRSDAYALVKWSGRYGIHVLAYHGTRSPKYAAKVAVWAPVGLVRAVWLSLRWAMAEEGNWGLRQYAANINDAATWLSLDRQRQRESVWRWWVILGGAIGTVVGLWALTRAPAWAQLAFLAVALPILATLGRPADRPITDRVVDGPRYKKLTAEVVRRALCAIGHAGINQAVAKDPGAISFPQEIHRDGPGYLAVVDLPFGVSAAEVVARRDRLASGLRLPMDQAWPATEKGHTGRLELFVGDEPASRMKQPPWPLLSPRAKVDIFRSFPFATDPRQRTISGSLMERNWLIGAMPGAGKTFALRLCLLAASLDTRVELRGYELKGTGDLDMLEDLCTEFASGIDDATIEKALGMLRRLAKECERRGPIVKRMAKAGKSPENKITPELANMQGLNLRPLVAFVDECQNLFAHPEYGKEAGELAEKIIKLGRALGIILLLATQRPDKDSLPKGISANAGVRFCLRVTGQVENDMVLGTSMYKQGIRATQFSDDERGWGWLIGLGKPTACKSFYVDGPGAARVVTRAADLRRAAGTMPEDLDLPADGPTYDLLADVLAVWPAGEARVWNETLLERLTGLRPEVYTGWKPDQLTSALKPHSVGTDQIGRRIDGVTVNRRGPARSDVEAAVAARNRSRPADTPS